jgi:hypothetical protein
METCPHCGKTHPENVSCCVNNEQTPARVDPPLTPSKPSKLSSLFKLKPGGKIHCTVVFAIVFLHFATLYIEGRTAMPLVLILLPLFVVLDLAMLFCAIVLLVMGIGNFANGIHRRLAINLLVLLFLALASLFFYKPAKIFQMGFRHRINSRVSPAQLREIARVCSNILPIDGRLPGPDKPLWNETEHRKVWDNLTNSTALGKLDPYVLIFNHEDKVELVWGGPLGHWGVIILKTGSGSGDIAPGIRTFNGPN